MSVKQLISDERKPWATLRVEDLQVDGEIQGGLESTQVIAQLRDSGSNLVSEITFYITSYFVNQTPQHQVFLNFINFEGTVTTGSTSFTISFGSTFRRPAAGSQVFAVYTDNGLAALSIPSSGNGYLIFNTTVTAGTLSVFGGGTNYHSLSIA